MKKLTLQRASIIMVMTLCAVAFLHMGTTQYFAHKLRYQDVFLGEPLVVTKRQQKMYLPWKVHTWSNQYKGGRIDSLIDKCAMILFIGSLASLGLSVAVILYKPAHRTTHGSARFATEDEVNDWGWTKTPMQRAKKLDKQGKPTREADSVTFAKTKSGKLLFDWGPAHVLFSALTRGGKGISAVIPTLLTWRGSTVVLDLKGENYAITGDWRSTFSHLIYFNPTKRSSARFNPLLEVRKGDYLIRDVMNIVEILSERSKSEQNIFWDSGAKRLLVVTIIYVLYTQEEKTLGKVADLILDVDVLLMFMAMTDFGDDYLNLFIHQTVVSFQRKDEKIRGGWSAGAEVILDLWKDPVVRAVTSTSDFRLRDFQHAAHPMSLYFVIPPGDIKRLSVFVRLFITQLTDALTEELDESVLEKTINKVKDTLDESKEESGDDEKWYQAFLRQQERAHQRKERAKKKPQKHFHRLLMLCDEFPQFGRMEKVERAVSYTAGYGIKWFFITQGFNQINEEYGKNNAIVPNCHIHLGLRCADVYNAEIWEQRLGMTTGVRKVHSRSAQRVSGGSRKVTESVSTQEFAKPLMSADEWTGLDENRLVVVRSGHDPYMAYRTTYYNDSRFKKKFEGRLLQWPRQRLNDFPSSVVEHHWGCDYINIEPMEDYDASVEERGLMLDDCFDGEPRKPYAPQNKESFEQANQVEPQEADLPAQAVDNMLDDMLGGWDVPTKAQEPEEEEPPQAVTTALSQEQLDSLKQVDALIASQKGHNHG